MCVCLLPISCESKESGKPALQRLKSTNNLLGETLLGAIAIFSVSSFNHHGKFQRGNNIADDLIVGVKCKEPLLDDTQHDMNDESQLQDQPDAKSEEVQQEEQTTPAPQTFDESQSGQPLAHPKRHRSFCPPSGEEKLVQCWVMFLNNVFQPYYLSWITCVIFHVSYLARKETQSPSKKRKHLRVHPNMSPKTKQSIKEQQLERARENSRAWHSKYVSKGVPWLRLQIVYFHECFYNTHCDLLHHSIASRYPGAQTDQDLPRTRRTRRFRTRRRRPRRTIPRLTMLGGTSFLGLIGYWTNPTRTSETNPGLFCVILIVCFFFSKVWTL